MCSWAIEYQKNLNEKNKKKLVLYAAGELDSCGKPEPESLFQRIVSKQPNRR